MKRFSILVCSLFMLSSCTSELDQLFNLSRPEVLVAGPVFYATTESSSIPETKTFADSQMRVLWNAGDQISIFNKITYNQGFEFDGDDGDTAGGFNPFTQMPMFGSWEDLDYIYAVYPYSTNNKCGYDGDLTVMLPAEQSYKESSFGIGANTMVAVTEGSRLRFKNVGGYLSLRLYGDNVKVSSVTIKGNNGEKIAGKATVTIPLDGTPTTVMDNSATDAITIVCDPAVQLGADAEHYTDFWFVIPPVTFTGGFKITVMDDQGGIFERATSRSQTVVRNQMDWMYPLEVTPSYENTIIEFEDPLVKSICVANWDTDGDEEISRGEAAAVTNLGNDFRYSDISSFNELQYFTGLTELNNSFDTCIHLTEITLPDGLTRIGNGAFLECVNLAAISIPSSVLSIDGSAFRYCISLTEINIPFGLTSIGENAFNGCSGLTNITIPSTVTSIGRYAFGGCSGLTDITIPSLSSISDGTFNGCSGITTISIPSTVTSIGEFAFSKCNNLRSIFLNEGLTSIGYAAFAECGNLPTIDLPQSLQSVDSAAFHLCNNLRSFTGKFSSEDGRCLILDGRLLAIAPNDLDSYAIPFGVTAISGYAFTASELSEVIIPEGVTYISDYAFLACDNIESITFPHSLEYLGADNFRACSKLKTVDFQENIKSIGVACFTICTSLQRITIRAILPPMLPNESYSPFGQSNECPVFVPQSALDVYNNADIWNTISERLFPIL